MKNEVLLVYYHWAKPLTLIFIFGFHEKYKNKLNVSE